MTNKTTTLGIDIGTNSIGWCWVTKDENLHILSIDGIGVRIFPVGVKEDSYLKSHSEISKNAGRRMARTTRRRYDRRRLRRQHLQALLTEKGMMPDLTNDFSARELYALRAIALEKRVELTELGRIWWHLNQRRGFKSSRKDASTDDKEKGKVKEGISALAKAIEESGKRTLGEYFYSLFPAQGTSRNDDEPTERIRARWVSRAMYEQEFDTIWEKQAPLYPLILTNDFKKQVKEEAIFYQRPLKSQKHLISKCRFEPAKRCMPRSMPLFQEFRLWQTIANLRVTTDIGNRVNAPLTLDEKLRLADALTYQEKMTITQVAKLLGLHKTAFDQNIKEVKGNYTVSRLAAVIGGRAAWESLTAAQQQVFYHTLLFADSPEWVENYAITKLGLSLAQAKAYAALPLEQDYSSISYKAAEGIVAQMKIGDDYTAATAACGYHHSFDEGKQGKDRPLADALPPEGVELRNPLVQMSVNEVKRLVNALIKEYGKPDEIRVELAREMKKTKDIREKIHSQQRKKAEEREKNYLRLRKELDEKRIHHPRITKEDMLKYELWLESNQKSPYSGQPIALETLFTAEIEVEHIYPYSKSMDNSFGNKALCEREINREKGNRTAMEFFNLPSQAANRTAFLQAVKELPDGKRKRMLTEHIPADFLNQQLNNTAYIGKEVVKLLQTVCRRVMVTNGQATALLRKEWGLNGLTSYFAKREENPDPAQRLYKEQNEYEEGKEFVPTVTPPKSREDHRHHAIDALTIAATNTALLQKLATDLVQFTPEGKLYLPQPVPSPLAAIGREGVRDHLKRLIISFKNDKRLLTARKNLYTHSAATKKSPQTTLAVRGALHEETFYGKIIHPKTGKEVYVTRKPIESITSVKHLEKIMDAGIRAAIERHILHHAGAITEAALKKAFEKPVMMRSSDGKKEWQIKRVRMEGGSDRMIELRKGVFVESGSNYCIAIYENETTQKRSSVTVRFYDAVQRARKGEPLVEMMNGKDRFIFSLQQKDMVLRLNVNETEADIDWTDTKKLATQIYRVAKFDVNGQIGLVRHNAANVAFAQMAKYREGSLLVVTANSGKMIKIKVDVLGRITRA